MRANLIFSFLWIRYCIQQAFCCNTTSSQYARFGDNVTIEFEARTVNSQNSSLIVTNQILSNKYSALLTAVYQNGVNTYISSCNGCVFAGNATTGNLSIRFDDILTTKAGTYRHTFTETTIEVKECVLVYVLAVACSSTTTVLKYKRPGDDVTIQFQAITVHFQDSTLFVINQILSNDDIPLISAMYQNNLNTYISSCNKCTFTGNASTGELFIKLDNIQSSQGGTYVHSATETSAEVKGCVLIYVLGEPTKPSITVNKEPFEGESVVLTCSSTSTTIPKDPNLRMVYNWKVDNEEPSDTRFTYSGTKNKLTISTVRRADVNKQFTCTAKEDVNNTFTSSSSSPLKFDVYYAPTVKPFKIDPMVEGSALSVECKADPGFPTDTTFTWKRKLNSSTLTSWQDITGSSINGGQLEIQNISRTDAGMYKCTASNIMSPPANQQAGSSFQIFLLNVLYPASITSFLIEGHAGKTEVTLNENDELIQLTCEVDSNPVSTVKLLFRDKVQKEVEDVKRLLFTFSSVSCLDSGEYICEGNNGIRVSSKKPIHLNVNCSPRPLYRINENISSSLSTKTTISFTALAYPHPGAKGFAWYKRNGEHWTQLLANNDVQIISTTLQSNLTILNITKTDYGLYKLIIKNEIGTYVQHFNLAEKKKDDKGSDSEQTQNKLVIVVPVVITVLLILVCVVPMIILYKRKSNRKAERKSANQTKTQQEYANASYNAEAMDDQQNNSEQNVGSDALDEDDKRYMHLTEYSRDDKRTYDILNVQQP